MITLDSRLSEAVDHHIDQNHEVFCKLGRRFFEEFRKDRTQIRNLQQIAYTAIRFADIEDFVKNQMGKEKVGSGKGKWQSLGGAVLEQLTDLRDRSQQLDDDPANQFVVRLHLARGWVRAVVGEYLYQAALAQMRESHDAR